MVTRRILHRPQPCAEGGAKGDDPDSLYPHCREKMSSFASPVSTQNLPRRCPPVLVAIFFVVTVSLICDMNTFVEHLNSLTLNYCIGCDEVSNSGIVHFEVIEFGGRYYSRAVNTILQLYIPFICVHMLHPASP